MFARFPASYSKRNTRILGSRKRSCLPVTTSIPSTFKPHGVFSHDHEARTSDFWCGVTSHPGSDGIAGRRGDPEPRALGDRGREEQLGSRLVALRAQATLPG